jgi:hypothetical protein
MAAGEPPKEEYELPSKAGHSGRRTRTESERDHCSSRNRRFLPQHFQTSMSLCHHGLFHGITSTEAVDVTMCELISRIVSSLLANLYLFRILWHDDGAPFTHPGAAKTANRRPILGAIKTMKTTPGLKQPRNLEKRLQGFFVDQEKCCCEAGRGDRLAYRRCTGNARASSHEGKRAGEEAAESIDCSQGCRNRNSICSYGIRGQLNSGEYSKQLVIYSFMGFRCSDLTDKLSSRRCEDLASTI